MEFIRNWRLRAYGKIRGKPEKTEQTKSKRNKRQQSEQMGKIEYNGDVEEIRVKSSNIHRLDNKDSVFYSIVTIALCPLQMKGWISKIQRVGNIQVAIK